MELTTHFETHCDSKTKFPILFSHNLKQKKIMEANQLRNMYLSETYTHKVNAKKIMLPYFKCGIQNNISSSWLISLGNALNSRKIIRLYLGNAGFEMGGMLSFIFYSPNLDVSFSISLNRSSADVAIVQQSGLLLRQWLNTSMWPG